MNDRTIPMIRRSAVLMDTLVSSVVVGERLADAEEAIGRAIKWFNQVEACSSRFDPRSEVMGLTERVGVPVAVSPMLFEVLGFALAVSAESDGAFDPTVGLAMERRGFNRNYLTGRRISTRIDSPDRCDYRDVRLDAKRGTVTLRRPLVLDLGAVAKGFAIDLAARELARYPNLAIDAGGDLFFRGTNTEGEPWRVGIRHPRRPGDLIETLRVTDTAVCTSGDYERRAEADGGGHILAAGSGQPADAVASVTVIAPTAMAADALGTAAFALGPARGIALLERQGVEGVIYSPSLGRSATAGIARCA
ncbi:MAG: FAD:protein FMN transferase [Chloroflexota bacterium]